MEDLRRVVQEPPDRHREDLRDLPFGVGPAVALQHAEPGVDLPAAGAGHAEHRRQHADLRGVHKQFFAGLPDSGAAAVLVLVDAAAGEADLPALPDAGTADLEQDMEPVLLLQERDEDGGVAPSAGVKARHLRRQIVRNLEMRGRSSLLCVL